MRMRLSVAPDIQRKLHKHTSESKPIKTHARYATITPDMINKSFMIHNGKNYILVKLTEHMIGHKLGEFVPTRKFKGHSGKKTK